MFAVPAETALPKTDRDAREKRRSRTHPEGLPQMAAHRVACRPRCPILHKFTGLDVTADSAMEKLPSM